MKVYVVTKDREIDNIPVEGEILFVCETKDKAAKMMAQIAVDEEVELNKKEIIDTNPGDTPEFWSSEFLLDTDGVSLDEIELTSPDSREQIYYYISEVDYYPEDENNK